MAAEKGNNYAKDNKGGNPGYGKLKNLKDNVDKFSPLFWEGLNDMMKGDKTDKKWAMQEFNKIQLRMIPQDITSGGNELQPILVKFIDAEDNKHSNGVQEAI